MAERATVQRSSENGQPRRSLPRPETEAEIAQELFETMNELDLTYVVGRKYDDLPETIIGDIDIYVEDRDFDKVLKICEGLGLEKRQSTPRSPRHIDLLKKAVENPQKAVDTVLNTPRKIPRMIRGKRKSSTGSSHSNHRNRKMENDELVVDFRNNLAYKSPMDGTRIQVKPRLTDLFFERRRLHNGFYVPSPCDELGHIIPHCVFDKSGTFSQYYVDRCGELVEIVTKDPEQDEQFRELLSDIFYKAEDLVYDLTVEGEYDTILPNLYRYTDY